MTPSGPVAIVAYIVVFLFMAVVVLGGISGGFVSPIDAYQRGWELIRRALLSLFG